ncbi:hypothetical protein ACIGGF_16165 [Rhodococcus sp. NPDC078407]
MTTTSSVEVRSATASVPQPAPTRRRRFPSLRNTWSGLWRPLALVAVLIAAWWAVTASELVAPYILP